MAVPAVITTVLVKVKRNTSALVTDKTDEDVVKGNIVTVVCSIIISFIAISLTEEPNVKDI